MPNANHAKYAFLYLLAFFTLFFVVLGAGQVLFQIINISFPMGDQYYGDGGLSVLRFGLSSMLVAAPIFYFTTRAINRGIAAKDYSLDAGVRRWLTYVVLLVASGTAIGDLIFAFNSYLAGELTLRAGLKILVILALAAMVLGYYLHDIRRTNPARTPFFTWSSALFPILTLAVFAAGLWYAGTPAAARAVQEDNARVSELQRLSSSVSEYYARYEVLPPDLETLLAEKIVFENDIADDVHGTRYGYTPGEGVSFSLCANFATAQHDRASGLWDAAWQHEAGEVCFDRVVDEWVLNRGK